MSTTEDTTDDTQSRDEHDTPDLNGLDVDRFESLAEDTTVEMPDGEEATLGQVMDDITEAHEAITQYKEGALATCNALDAAIIEARDAGEDDRADALQVVREACFGPYLRVQRGDAELFGVRDGKYSGYFN